MLGFGNKVQLLFPKVGDVNAGQCGVTHWVRLEKLGGFVSCYFLAALAIAFADTCLHDIPRASNISSPPEGVTTLPSAMVARC